MYPTSHRIIPQALSVRYGLGIGAACAPFVLGLMYLFAPVAWPIAKLLDAVLGTHDGERYRKVRGIFGVLEWLFLDGLGLWLPRPELVQKGSRHSGPRATRLTKRGRLGVARTC
jgi:hypothetical protein